MRKVFRHLGYARHPRLRAAALLAVTTALLQACGGGAAVQENLPLTAPSSEPGKSTNTAPTISGTPAARVTVGSTYSFAPRATDADNDALTFSIANKPAWATFNAATGTLSGTPTASSVGTFANVAITVSDGIASASLSPFSVTVAVTAPTGGTGSASVSWMPPTQRNDGSTLTNLSGYKIYYGNNANALTNVVTLTNAGLASYVIDNLASGTYYFAVTAYDSDGMESTLSNLASKVIG